MFWDGPQLKKEIEGPYGFRMRETYFLGEDGRRLFVIIRLGDLRQEATAAGVGRQSRLRSHAQDSTLGTPVSGPHEIIVSESPMTRR